MLCTRVGIALAGVCIVVIASRLRWWGCGVRTEPARGGEAGRSAGGLRSLGGNPWRTRDKGERTTSGCHSSRILRWNGIGVRIFLIYCALSSGETAFCRRRPCTPRPSKAELRFGLSDQIRCSYHHESRTSSKHTPTPLHLHTSTPLHPSKPSPPIPSWPTIMALLPAHTALASPPMAFQAGVELQVWDLRPAWMQHRGCMLNPPYRTNNSSRRQTCPTSTSTRL